VQNLSYPVYYDSNCTLQICKNVCGGLLIFFWYCSQLPIASVVSMPTVAALQIFVPV